MVRVATKNIIKETRKLGLVEPIQQWRINKVSMSNVYIVVLSLTKYIDISIMYLFRSIYLTQTKVLEAATILRRQIRSKELKNDLYWTPGFEPKEEWETCEMFMARHNCIV